MIYILSPGPPDAHVGGIRKLYDHAELLNRWWPTEIIPTYRAVPRERDPQPGDLVVFPEIYGDALHTAFPGVARISLNQNLYYTWGNVQAETHPYLDTPELLAVLTFSKHTAGGLRFAFGDELRIDQMTVCLDKEQGTEKARFYLGEFPRKRQLCYFGRKGGEVAAPILLGMLRARGSLEGVTVIDMAGMSDEDVAATMRESLLFLSFQSREGRGDPAIEAAMCGCRVVGFAGGGGWDWQLAWCEQDDFQDFTEAVEFWLDDRESTLETADRISERLQHSYSRFAEVAQLEERYREYVHLAER